MLWNNKILSYYCNIEGNDSRESIIIISEIIFNSVSSSINKIMLNIYILYYYHIQTHT